MDGSRRRAYSFTAATPERIRRKDVRRLAREIRERYPGVDPAVEAPNQVDLAVVRKPGRAGKELG